MVPRGCPPNYTYQISKGNFTNKPAQSSGETFVNFQPLLVISDRLVIFSGSF